ncbi:MAG: D-alanine--D-alanine ligase [Bacilli bacterium]|nr:D-alanine--D-alanine ligase [Bacilli bacterium]
MIKVGVIFGGETVEHEVSIISAVQAMNKLDNEKYEIVPIYITKEGEWYTGAVLREIETYKDMDLLKRYTKNVVLYRKDNMFVLQSKGLLKKIVNDIDIALPVVHGTNVEDGVLQGYLKTIGIPFVGSDVLASAISQDKVIQKQVFECANLPVAKYHWFYDSEYREDEDKVVKEIESKIDYPMIVKPATLGSSVGISSVENKKELKDAIFDAVKYDKKIVVEEKIVNLTEVNISVLGNYERVSTSAIEEVMTDNSLLTYEDKYIGGGKKTGSKGMASASRKIPADLPEKLEEEVREIAVSAFRNVGLSGVSRIDFLVDKKKKKVYINEINSCPGSLAFYLWDAVGKNFITLLDDMINIAIKNYKKDHEKIRSFDSNILSGYTGLKGAKGKFGKLK